MRYKVIYKQREYKVCIGACRACGKPSTIKQANKSSKCIRCIIKEGIAPIKFYGSLYCLTDGVIIRMVKEAVCVSRRDENKYLILER